MRSAGNACKKSTPKQLHSSRALEDQWRHAGLTLVGVPSGEPLPDPGEPNLLRGSHQEVAQVLPNGNLILEARSVTEVDGERSAIVVRGRCRAEDVSQLNTVYSTQLHDLEVTQHSGGELRRASSKPWITRLLESVFGV